MCRRPSAVFAVILMLLAGPALAGEPDHSLPGHLDGFLPAARSKTTAVGHNPDVLRNIDPLRRPAAIPPDAVRFTPANAPTAVKIVPRLQERAASTPMGTPIKVVVLLVEPQGVAAAMGSGPVMLASRTDQIAALEHDFVARAQRSAFRARRGMRNFPIVAGTVPPEMLDEVASLPTVRFIEPDEELRATRVEGGALIRATQLRNELGATGKGITVAVIDSGIDWNHPELSGKVVAGADYTGTQTSDPGMDDYGHGTAVAGIIAGGQGGMAPEAHLLALKVFTAEGSGNSSWTLAALDGVYEHRNDFGGIRVVNMSLGVRDVASFGYCDTSFPANAEAIDKVVGAGIAVMAASGNEGCKSGISVPACLTHTISVGAVYDANLGGFQVPPNAMYCNPLGYTDSPTHSDLVPGYSNTAPILDVFAPSDCATTTKMGGGYKPCFNGTSAAAPYVAGVAAQLLSLRTGTSPAELRQALRNTGRPVTDPRNTTITRPRIDAMEAYTELSGGGTEPADYLSWLPVAVHLPGAQGSQWRSDVALLNLGTGAATVTVTAHLSSGTIEGELSEPIPPLHQVILEDLIGQLEASGYGAIRIESSQPLTVTSRSYSQEADGTFGQFIDVSYGGWGLAAGEVALLQHLIQTSSFRTNIGIANFGNRSAQGTVTLVDENGYTVGALPFSLSAGGYTQFNQPFTKKFGRQVLGGTAVIEVGAGEGVVAYASVIDNGSNDPTTIPMITTFPATTQWVPVVVHLPGAGGSQWRSDLALLNPGQVAASITFTAHLSSGTVEAHLSASLQPGQQVVISDFVGQLERNDYGTLEITSTQPVTVTSRSYSQEAKGTFGQFLAAHGVDDGLIAGEMGLIQHLVQNAEFRSNIGVANFGPEPAEGVVSLFDETGAPVGNLPFSLGPGGYTQFNQPYLKQFGRNVLGGAAIVQVTSGTGVVAYASVIDNGSNDPTTIPMLH